MTATWNTIEQTYPNGDKYTVTVIRFDNSLRESYYHVEGGFVVDRYKRNCKIYPTETSIRHVLLKKLQAKVRRWDCEVGTAIALNQAGNPLKQREAGWDE